jgi:Ni/Fe-hydrogenase subunit HybB-like protein
MIGTLRRIDTASPWFFWVGFLGLLLLIGAVSGVLVLLNGLKITALTNRVPWGLWITVDLSAIALGAGAF